MKATIFIALVGLFVCGQDLRADRHGGRPEKRQPAPRPVNQPLDNLVAQLFKAIQQANDPRPRDHHHHREERRLEGHPERRPARGFLATVFHLLFPGGEAQGRRR